MMDNPSRLIGLAAALAWAIFRVVRYFKAGASKRPAPAVPRAAGLGVPPSAPAASPVAEPGTTSSAVSPIDSGGGPGLLGGFVAVLVWLAGNAIVWGCLFLVPQLEPVPVMLRLVTGVLINFYLIYLARRAAAWARSQKPPPPPEGGNPIS
jgi:hypothetical protein